MKVSSLISFFEKKNKQTNRRKTNSDWSALLFENEKCNETKTEVFQ